MSSNFPALMGKGEEPAVPYHVHAASEIYGTLTIGDFRSANWDGGGDLSTGPDLSATAGYFFDASAGVAQMTVLYWEQGAVVAHPASAGLSVRADQTTGAQFSTVTPAAAGMVLTRPALARHGNAGAGGFASLLPVTMPQASPVAAPHIRSSSSGVATWAVGGWEITAPPTIADGDTVLVIYANDGADPWVATGAWLLAGGGERDSFSTVSVGVIYKKCSGGLPVGGSTIAPGRGATGGACTYVAYAIVGADTTVNPPEAVLSTGDGSNPNPPNLTPTGGSRPYLWVAAYGMGVNGESGGLTGWPANFTLSQLHPEDGNDCHGAAAGYVLEAASLNPATYTTDVGDRSWVAATVAVYP